MNNKTYGKYTDGKLFLYGKSFSNKRFKGAQRKGMVFIDDTQELFIKADEVTKAREDTSNLNRKQIGDLANYIVYLYAINGR